MLTLVVQEHQLHDVKVQKLPYQAIITSCMCKLDDNYLFLGSRVGNSLLLRLWEETTTATTTTPLALASSTPTSMTPTPPGGGGDGGGDRPAKSRKQWSGRPGTDDYFDEDVMYGATASGALTALGSSHSNGTGTYKLEVCDNLLNIAS